MNGCESVSCESWWWWHWEKRMCSMSLRNPAAASRPFLTPLKILRVTPQKKVIHNRKRFPSWKVDLRLFPPLLTLSPMNVWLHRSSQSCWVLSTLCEQGKTPEFGPLTHQHYSSTLFVCMTQKHPSDQTSILERDVAPAVSERMVTSLQTCQKHVKVSMINMLMFIRLMFVMFTTLVQGNVCAKGQHHPSKADDISFKTILVNDVVVALDEIIHIVNTV